MSHTPGPWSINRHYIESETGLCRARIAIIDDGAGTNPEENAALIAAAPEMLATLLKLAEPGVVATLSLDMWNEIGRVVEKATCGEVRPEKILQLVEE